jgi:hypothetical protein
MFADFYHRSLVSVIKEKLSSPNNDPLFHYQPYTVKWQPSSTSEPINVYREFYTSQAFLDADRELQNTPKEPKCDLPRHIVALMFHSDATHLTSFGDAKLWPLYLYFGNESKYRHVRPSCHLACHVAYFQRVRSSCISSWFSLTFFLFLATRFIQGFCKCADSWEIGPK